MESITKHSDTELKVSKTVVEDVIISKDALLDEKAGRLESIENFKNQITSLQSRVAEIDVLLGEAVKLGIKTKEEKDKKAKK